MENNKDEFYKAVKSGREIEFRYKGKHYFESRNDDHSWYIYCEETEDRQCFSTPDELLLLTILENANINDVWNDIKIDYVL